MIRRIGKPNAGFAAGRWAICPRANSPVLRYNRQLMQAILHNRMPIAKIVNAQVIPLDDAPRGYADFDKGAAMKFVLDPHGIVAKAA